MISVKQIGTVPYPLSFEDESSKTYNPYWYTRDKTLSALAPIIQDQVAKTIANAVWELCSDEISPTRSISKT